MVGASVIIGLHAVTFGPSPTQIEGLLCLDVIELLQYGV